MITTTPTVTYISSIKALIIQSVFVYHFTEAIDSIIKMKFLSADGDQFDFHVFADEIVTDDTNVDDPPFQLPFQSYIMNTLALVQKTRSVEALLVLDESCLLDALTLCDYFGYEDIIHCIALIFNKQTVLDVNAFKNSACPPAVLYEFYDRLNLEKRLQLFSNNIDVSFKNVNCANIFFNDYADNRKAEAANEIVVANTKQLKKCIENLLAINVNAVSMDKSHFSTYSLINFEQRVVANFSSLESFEIPYDNFIDSRVLRELIQNNKTTLSRLSIATPFHRLPISEIKKCKKLRFLEFDEIPYENSVKIMTSKWALELSTTDDAFSRQPTYLNENTQLDTLSFALPFYEDNYSFQITVKPNATLTLRLKDFKIKMSHEKYIHLHFEASFMSDASLSTTDFDFGAACFKSLRISNICDVPIKTLLDDVTRHCTHLDHLCIDAQTSFLRNASLLCRLTSLKSLEFECHEIDDNVLLAIIQRQSMLKTLKVTSTNKLEKCMQYIRNSTSICAMFRYDDFATSFYTERFIGGNNIYCVSDVHKTRSGWMRKFFDFEANSVCNLKSNFSIIYCDMNCAEVFSDTHHIQMLYCDVFILLEKSLYTHNIFEL